MYKVVLVFDEKSKRTVKLENSMVSSEYISVVNSLPEIQLNMFDEQRTVIVLDGFLTKDSAVKELELYKDLGNFQYLFLLSISQNAALISSLGRVYQCDTSLISFELLQASLYSDNSFMIDSSSVQPASVKYALNVIASKSSHEQMQLARDYLDTIKREEQLIAQIKEKQDVLDDLLVRNTMLSDENDRWSNGCKTLLERIKVQNDSLKRYEVAFSQDVYYKFNLHSYQNRPVIIYLKQFTEFTGLNTFIETIVDAFRFQQRKSVKVLQLFDRSGNRQVRLLPEYYCVLRNHYQIQDVISNDYLCKSGDYANLLDRLLTNKYKLDVLLIVDRKDYDDVVISGSFLQYNLCQTPAQAVKLALTQSTTIVNQKESGWLCWSPVRLNDYTKKERFIKLSSRKVIQKILVNGEKLANSF